MTQATIAMRADFAACHAIIARGSKSFALASRLLPDELRDAVAALYAFCRQSDDSVDARDAVDRHGAPARLTARLDAVMAGAPRAGPVDRALAVVMARYALPRAPLDALIEGLAWDLEERRYETLDALEAYAARVAGSVGVMMAALMGARTPDLLARAGDLGVAMQYTNIARDVGEDARMGRVYLPCAWLAAAGVDVADFLRHPRALPGVCAATLRLLDEADALYARADAGIAGLAPTCRPAIRAARAVYAEIGVRVRAAGGDGVSARARTTATRKAVLAARALAPTWPQTAARSAAGLTQPALPANQYLVKSATLHGAAPFRRKSWFGRADEAWGRVFDLFSELETRRPYRAVR
jgi:phytoene synthase